MTTGKDVRQNLVIRLAKQTDLVEIVAIYNTTIASRMVTADLNPVSLSERQQWFDNHLMDEQRPIFVCEQNEVVVAWGSLGDYYPREAYRISAEISIYVHAQYRGQGIGGILLEYMLQQAIKMKICNVLAIVFAHNLPSLRLFNAYGFSQWGRLPKVCDLDGELADVLILGKNILEGKSV